MFIPHETTATHPAQSVSVRDQIRLSLSTMPHSQALVGELILKDPAAVTGLTSVQLATAAGVSQPTVTRFCRALGLPSYHALLIELARETGYIDDHVDSAEVLGGIHPDDSADDVIRTLTNLDVEAMQLAARTVDRAALDTAAAMISLARQVDVYGAGASGIVAREMQLRLYRIGFQVYAWTEVHAAALSAALRSPDDAVIAVSASGRTRETLSALQAARDRGARAIALTGNADSPIARAADVNLTTFGHTTPFRSMSFAARHAQLLILDILFTRVAQLDPERTARNVDATTHIASDHRINDNHSERP